MRGALWRQTVWRVRYVGLAETRKAGTLCNFSDGDDDDAAAATRYWVTGDKLTDGWCRCKQRLLFNDRTDVRCRAMVSVHLERRVTETVGASVAYPWGAQTYAASGSFNSSSVLSWPPAPSLSKFAFFPSGNKPMRVCFGKRTGSYFVLHHTGLSQQPQSCSINNGGSRAVPATAAAGRGEGRAHRWCWDGSARHQHAAQQRIQRERRAVQEIQVMWRCLSMMRASLQSYINLNRNYCREQNVTGGLDMKETFGI